MRIDGKVVLITGASQGIGAACAAEFARAGARLSLAARTEEGMRKAGGAGALVTPADITTEDGRRRVVDNTLQHFGAIDIVINNAGVGLYSPSWDTPMEEVRRLMELNFFAVIGMNQLVVPHLRAQRSGMVVNVGSIGGKMTLPWLTVYCASKYALGALTDGLRMELRGAGVQAMLVCPGYVTTGFQQNVIKGKAPAKVLEGRRFAVSAAECARDIRRGVERGARTVMSPRVGWLLVAAMRLFPSVVEARMAEMNGTA